TFLLELVITNTELTNTILTSFFLKPKLDQDCSIKQKLRSMKEYNKDDINIATYFKKTSCHSKDIKAETHVQHFAKHKGFKIQLGHLKTVNMAENEKAT
ncbi:2715_t:CDS:2, partial [Cetraspora pellucida]